ncbi:Solute carrier family 40 protein [Aphelenchoides fujianensis]|nr:Solute carrier family 40 protein [Aphelenchoides fujianensis]
MFASNSAFRRALPTRKFAVFYAAYVASCLGDNLWYFAVLFVLESLGSMRLVGVYQLTENVFIMLLSASVWKWMDKYDRHKGTLTVLAANNLAIAASALLLAACLSVAAAHPVLYVLNANWIAWLRRITRTFWQQEVFSAGICLALMFMTVLGFDGSASALLGVVGAVAYSQLEKRVGVRWTGICGLSIQQIFLWICVASVFLPGTLFDPAGYAHDFSWAGWWHEFVGAFSVDSPQKGGNQTMLSATTPAPTTDLGRPPLAIVVYFVGVTFARIGVWIVDLAIMQLMQESVKETDRLSVFGVENALCQFFFVGKDVMAIVAPDVRTYGILILISVLFVMSGFAFYLFYFLKTRKRE